MQRFAVYLLLSGCWIGALSAQKTATVLDSIVIEMAPEGGFYPHAPTISLFAPGADAIYYTTDGTAPSPRSLRYTGPIRLGNTCVVRAVAYRDKQPSRYFGQTYFINEPASTLPVLSIGVTPELLFDRRRGIFMQGSRAIDTLWQKPGANFWTRQEFPVHIEIFETDGRTVYNSPSGLRLFGGMSRLFPQKSMAIVARSRYGEDRIHYPVLGPEAPKSFKYLVLRNSGSDFGRSHMRDALMTGLVSDWDMETQAYRPAHVYINGYYWGIYNLREKVNRYFLADHSEDIDKDSIDLLEHYLTLKQGSKYHYLALLEFLKNHDLRNQAHFDHLATLMDVDNFMRLQIAQVYFDNQDAGGNIKFWRPQTPTARWRWVLYDTDWGFGLHGPKAYRNNSLLFHTESKGPNWPNPPWSTFLLRKLLENDGFRQRFVNCFADYLNTTFAAPRVMHHIDSLYQQLLPEMPRHLARWRLERRDWENQIEVLRTFARERPTYMRMHLMDFFQTGAQRDFVLETDSGGHVLVNNNITVGKEGLSGRYFADIPITLRAVPAYGHRFVGWEGIEAETEQRDLKIKLKENRPYRLRARFEPYAHPLLGQIVINEICAKNKNTGDWIELHNRSGKTVNLGGWVLTDRRNEFALPEVELAPRDYLIICRDAQRFREVFPQAYNVVGGLDFGLNKRHETLGLFSRLGASVDSLSYEVPPLDTAFTLSLLLPELDNADPENWEVRLGNGTPNAPNPYYVESNIRLAQSRWLQIGAAVGVFLLSLLLLHWRRRGVL